MGELSSVIGEVVKIGQSISTDEGMKFRRDCKHEVVAAFDGKVEDDSRLVKMWTSALYVVRKVHLP